MKFILQITMAAAVAVGALSLTSCGGCCTSEEAVPGLRPLPSFDEPAPVIDYSK